MSFNTRIHAGIRSALVAGALAVLAGVGATGCAATVTAEPATADVVFSYPVVRVETAPARVYERPHVHYRGREAYLVDGRWYYPTDRGWVYFREEPTELRRYREAHADSREPRHYQAPQEERRRRYYD